MTVKSKKFTKGVITKPTTTPASESGEQRTDSASNEQKIYLDGAERTVVTEDQAQTLSNKAIDSANNAITVDADEATVQNLETDNLKAGVLETDLNNAVTDTNLASAASIKTYVAQELATQDEASEISYDDTGNDKVTGANVQAALDSAETAIDNNETAASNAQSTADNHIADAVGAHAASAIANTPSGNLAATDVQSALNEIQTEVDGKVDQTYVDNHINDTVDAHLATAIGYDDTSAAMTESTVQGAIDDLDGRVENNASGITNLGTNLSDHITDAVDAHDASAISNVASGNLIATDVQGALNELQTDVDTRATDADLTSHTGATVAHGATGAVVGTTNTQTLTNKTIDGATITSPAQSDVKQDTRANLDVYASSADDGQTVFATDEKKYYGIKDNSLVSLGGGVGSPQTIDLIEADDRQDASDFSGNHTDITNGSPAAIDGTLSLSTTATDLLTGVDAVFKYVSSSSSQDDYFGYDITIPQGWGGRTLAVELTYRTASGYVNGDVSVELLSDNGTTVSYLKEKNQLLDNKESVDSNGVTKRYLVNVPTDIETLKVAFQNQSTTSGIELYVDKISADINDFNYKNVESITEWEDYVPTTQGLGTPTIQKARWRQVGSSYEFDVKLTVGTPTAVEGQISLPNSGIIDATAVPSVMRAASIMNDIADTNNYILLATGGDSFLNISSQGASAFTPQNGSAILSAGDVISFQASVPIEGLSASSKYVVVEGESILTNVVDDGVITIGATTTAPTIPSSVFANSQKWRRVADCMEIQLDFGYSNNSGGANGSGDYLLSIPGGYSIDTSKIDVYSTLEGDGAIGQVKGVIGNGHVATGSESGLCSFVAYNGSQYRVFVRKGAFNAVSFSGCWGSGSNGMLAASYYFSGTIRVPILGWDSDVIATNYLVPVNEQENTFSGIVTAAGNVDSSTQGFIVDADVVLTDTSLYTIDISRLGLTEIPTAFAKVEATVTTGTTSERDAKIQSVSTTEIVVRTHSVNSSSSNTTAYAALPFNLFIQKQNADYNEPRAFIGEAYITKVAYLKDVKSAGTAGGTFTSGAWQTRDLNTLEGNNSFISLSGNQFILQSGTYSLEALAPAYAVDDHISKLYNISGASDHTIGLATRSHAAASDAGMSPVYASIEITEATTFEIQHRCSATKASDGFGNGQNFGVDNVFTQVKITKVK